MIRSASCAASGRCAVAPAASVPAICHGASALGVGSGSRSRPWWRGRTAAGRVGGGRLREHASERASSATCSVRAAGRSRRATIRCASWSGITRAPRISRAASAEGAGSVRIASLSSRGLSRWVVSSVGRASRSQCEGQGFKSPTIHQLNAAQAVGASRPPVFFRRRPASLPRSSALGLVARRATPSDRLEDLLVRQLGVAREALERRTWRCRSVKRTVSGSTPFSFCCSWMPISSTSFQSSFMRPRLLPGRRRGAEPPPRSPQSFDLGLRLGGRAPRIARSRWIVTICAEAGAPAGASGPRRGRDCGCTAAAAGAAALASEHLARRSAPRSPASPPAHHVAGERHASRRRTGRRPPSAA